MKSVKAATALALSLLALLGCSSERKASDALVATVGEEKIYASDIDFLKRTSSAYAKPGKEQDALQNIVESRVIFQEAKRVASGDSAKIASVWMPCMNAFSPASMTISIRETIWDIRTRNSESISIGTANVSRRIPANVSKRAARLSPRASTWKKMRIPLRDLSRGNSRKCGKLPWKSPTRKRTIPPRLPS